MSNCKHCGNELPPKAGGRSYMNREYCNTKCYNDDYRGKHERVSEKRGLLNKDTTNLQDFIQGKL